MKVGGEREKKLTLLKSVASRVPTRGKGEREPRLYLNPFRTESSFERFFVSSPFRLLCRFLPLIRPVSTRDTARPSLSISSFLYLPAISSDSFFLFHRSRTMVAHGCEDRERALFSGGFQVLLVGSGLPSRAVAIC